MAITSTSSKLVFNSFAFKKNTPFTPLFNYFSTLFTWFFFAAQFTGNFLYFLAEMSFAFIVLSTTFFAGFTFFASLTLFRNYVHLALYLFMPFFQIGKKSYFYGKQVLVPFLVKFTRFSFSFLFKAMSLLFGPLVLHLTSSLRDILEGGLVDMCVFSITQLPSFLVWLLLFLVRFVIFIQELACTLLILAATAPCASTVFVLILSMELGYFLLVRLLSVCYAKLETLTLACLDRCPFLRKTIDFFVVVIASLVYGTHLMLYLCFYFMEAQYQWFFTSMYYRCFVLLSSYLARFSLFLSESMSALIFFCISSLVCGSLYFAIRVFEFGFLWPKVILTLCLRQVLCCIGFLLRPFLSLFAKALHSMTSFFGLPPKTFSSPSAFVFVLWALLFSKSDSNLSSPHPKGQIRKLKRRNSGKGMKKGKKANKKTRS